MVDILGLEALDCFSVPGVRSREMKSNRFVKTASDPTQVKSTTIMSEL